MEMQAQVAPSYANMRSRLPVLSIGVNLSLMRRPMRALHVREEVMKRAFVVAIGTALCVGPIAVSPLQAQTAARTPAAKAPVAKAPSAKAGPARSSSYRAPRNTFGQPDLGAYWTNASITNETRPAGLGDRLVYTPEEVRRLENEVQVEVEVGNRPTDPNAPTFQKGGQAVEPGTRAQFAGAGGGVGGYNRGWIDPGAAVMRVHGEPRTSYLTTPNGRPPARKTAAAAQARGLNAQGGEGDDAGPGRGGRGAGAPAAAPARGGGGGNTRANPEEWPLGERCIVSFGRNGGPPMLSNGFYNNNYNFVQSRDTVAIWVEMVHDVRTVRLNAKHRTDGVRPWFGDSIGHWEGETLVVETTNIPQAQAYNGSWQNLTITEKFTRVAANRLFYQYIINDPTAWDQPWGGEYEFDALPAGQHLYEYACHEGNYAMENMLAGARAEDAAARTRASATPATTTR